MKGNEAMGEAAVQAGCMAYFGYPITPQNELTAYMSRRMVEEGRVFIQRRARSRPSTCASGRRQSARGA